MIEPLRLSFDVDCPAQHAFDVWTAGISRRWAAGWREANEAGWASLLPHFSAACSPGT